MNAAHEFLKALTMVLGVAAVITVVFQRFHQPVVLGYVLAGLIIGPHVPVPLVADQAIVQTLSELGVILLMFSLGLEFSLRKLVQVGAKAALIAVIQSSIMVWLGFTVGNLFGWTSRESLFTGAIVAISSTTIVIKAFDESGVKGKLRELVVGILIVQDLIAILLMAALTAISTGAGLSAGALATTTLRLAAFLIGLVVVGMLIVPRAIRAISGLHRPETTLVSSIGLCFAIALLALEFGYTVALGAFIAGSLVSESGEEKTIERLVEPVRDMFAAIFFVSVGMLIEPALIVAHWPAIVVLTGVVIVGQATSVSLGAFLTGNGIRTSVQSGMSLAQIGEFSFIIAALGLSLKATGEFLYPVAVAVSVLTTLSTPWLIRASGPVANFVDRKLPRPLQTFAALYGSWVEQLSTAPPHQTSSAAVRRLLKLLFLDAALLAGVIIGVSLGIDRMAGAMAVTLGFTASGARALVLVLAGAIAAPFCFGVVRIARGLGMTLAEAALPAAGEGKVDLAAAPRRALVVTLQLAVVLLVGLPLMTLTQPFLPGRQGALLLALLLLVLGVAFWRSAANLQGHVRAGAELLVEALSAQASSDAFPKNDRTLSDVRQILPGLGEPIPVRLEADSPSVGKTLAQLNLRGVTGATVLAITRGDKGVLVPSAQEVLKPGDVLALAGTHDAVEAAKSLLEARAPVADAPFV